MQYTILNRRVVHAPLKARGQAAIPAGHAKSTNHDTSVAIAVPNPSSYDVGMYPSRRLHESVCLLKVQRPCPE
jgi:hypothetical protein